MKKVVSLINPDLFNNSMNTLIEYGVELQRMAGNLERISPGNPIIKDLLRQEDIINKIIKGFKVSKVDDEQSVKNLIDAINSLDDESALDVFNYEVTENNIRPEFYI